MPNATRCVLRTAPGVLVVGFVAVLSLGAQAPVERDDTEVAYAATHEGPVDPAATTIKTIVNEAQWEPGRVAMDWRRLRAFYMRRDYHPAWANASDAARVRDVLQNAAGEGLVAADYAADAIEPPSDADPHKLARYDVLLTNSLLAYAHDVRQGRIEPDEAYSDAEFRSHGSDYPAELQAALQNGSLEDYLKSLPPPQDGYRALRSLLARYRQIAANGGWPALPEGGRGLSRRLKERLSVEDYVSADRRQALSRFQAAHGLKATGALDQSTLAELNVGVGARIAQIEANMERWRWLPRNFEQRYVEVNVPAADLNVVDNGQVILSSRVVVGREKDPTPMLRADATSVTINPVWNIPSKIARKEILPKLRHNSSYFRRQGIRFVDRTNMKLEQLPGPKNPLGTIRIDMPNRFNVYLHDTPGQSVFARNMRDESHGCMRVEQILGLASIALGGNSGDPIADLTDAINSKQTQTIPLPSPLPVYVVYWTVTAGNDGSARFWPDIYGRDEQLTAELQKRIVGDRVSVL
jgi:murein L,D-transpeptidase YcbB/YkuD